MGMEAAWGQVVVSVLVLTLATVWLPGSCACSPPSIREDQTVCHCWKGIQIQTCKYFPPNAFSFHTIMKLKNLNSDHHMLGTVCILFVHKGEAVHECLWRKVARSSGQRLCGLVLPVPELLGHWSASF